MDSDIIVKRGAKDSVFVHLFQDKKYVLQLYKALHPEAVDATENMIEIITLENVLTDNIYNDLGFMIDKRLIVLVEAQSTWTANIIIRALMYLAQTYHDYISKEELNVYGSKALSLPEPELYVIYTGSRVIDKEVVTLSDEFFGGKKTDLEVSVHVLTDGVQGDIIYQYVAFTKVLDDQIRMYGRTREAVTETIRICKDRNLLKQYLTEHEQEVRDIMVTLFDNETILKGYTREKENAALNEGISKGERKKALEAARNLIKEGLPVELIARALNLPLAEINEIKSQMAN